MKNKLIENLSTDEEALRLSFKSPQQSYRTKYLSSIILILILIITIIVFTMTIKYNNKMHSKYILLKDKVISMEQNSKNYRIKINELNQNIANNQKNSSELLSKINTLNKDIDELNSTCKITEFNLLNKKSIIKSTTDRMYALFNEINAYQSIKSINLNKKYFPLTPFEYMEQSSKTTLISNIIRNNEELAYIEKITGYRLGKQCYSSTQHKFVGQLFRNYCKEIVPTVSLYLTDNYKRFGGFTMVAWGKEDMKVDNESFIFNLDMRKRWLAKNDHETISIAMGSFPSFGDGDIKANASGVCTVNKFHKSFEVNEKDYEINGGLETFRIISLEVFELQKLE